MVVGAGWCTTRLRRARSSSKWPSAPSCRTLRGCSETAPPMTWRHERTSLLVRTQSTRLQSCHHTCLSLWPTRDRWVRNPETSVYPCPQPLQDNLESLMLTGPLRPLRRMDRVCIFSDPCRIECRNGAAQHDLPGGHVNPMWLTPVGGTVGK